jgi:hypothetical protein
MQCDQTSLQDENLITLCINSKHPPLSHHSHFLLHPNLRNLTMSQGTAVDLTQNSRYKPDGRKAYLKAMRKWKFDPPYVPLALSLTNREDSLVYIDHRFKMMMARTEDGHNLGEVAAESTDEDVYYLSPVYIGEGDKKQLVMLDFDTGSSDLWGEYF